MNATLLPVLVKCCVLSKRQPRMCQPSHLTLPNGLLNADIKLTRSFALPFSSLSLHFALITSPSHPVPHPVTHLSSPSLSPSFVCSVYQPLAPSLSLFPCCCLSTPSDFSFNYSPQKPFLQVVFIYSFSYG